MRIVAAESQLYEYWSAFGVWGYDCSDRDT
jgi:hypothetical protein